MSINTTYLQTIIKTVLRMYYTALYDYIKKRRFSENDSVLHLMDIEKQNRPCTKLTQDEKKQGQEQK